MRGQTDDAPPPMPTVDEIAGAAGGSGGGDRYPMGFNRDSVTSFMHGYQPGTGAYPRYFSGDENMAAGKPPEDVARLQQALISAGLLDPDKVVAAGAWNTPERGAFKKLLTFANLNGLRWQEALRIYSDMAAQGRATGQGYGANTGPEVPQFQAQVTNPDDLRLALKDASSALRAGGAFDDDTIERLVRVYQAQETEDQRAAFNAELHGGTVVAPRSAETMLRDAVREEDPSGVGAREFADRAEEFFGALGSPVTPTRL